MTQQPGLTASHTPPRILIVDDEAHTRILLKLRLQREGYSVDEASSGQEALALVNQSGLPQLAILNLLLPDLDGFAVAAALRGLGDVLIIFLSALSDTHPKVRAFRRYAEDYVTKPFVFADLLARIRRVMLRTSADTAPAAEAVLDESLQINFTQHYLLVNQVPIKLTPLETQLLRLLYSDRGRVLSSDFLRANAWPPQRTVTKQALWGHIRRLRQKLEPDPTHPRYLITIRRQGYCLRPSSQTDGLLT